MYRDKNGKILQAGDVIDIHETVNGCNLFNIISIEPLDIEYSGLYHPSVSGRKYEYDKEELLTPSHLTEDVDWEILNKIKGRNLETEEDSTKVSNFSRIVEN